jgi:polyisoprenoid-binding protein YceI
MIWRKFVLAAAVVSGSWLPASLARAADAYQADPVHSSLVFRVKHMNTSYIWGRFDKLSGAFVLNEQDPASSQFDFQVETASVDTGNPMRDKHLQSPDFFNAVQYKTIAFKSKSVTSSGPGTFEVTGDLTLHGVTKPLTVKITKTGEGKNQMGKPIVGIDSSFAIRQSDFGMTKMVGPVSDDVWINVSIEAGKK